MKTIVALVIALSATQALADGFVCQTHEGDLRIRVYNNVQPSAGTRTGAVMVLSAPDIGQGNKTIAKFTAVNATLSSHNVAYTGKVDLRFNDSGRQGELISGTKLGQLASVYLNIGFSYSAPISKGQTVPAALTLVKRNGDRIERGMECARYLKGE